jgi:hypothetical protein
MTQTNLARAGLPDFDVFIAKDFGTTGFVETYGFSHAFYSPISHFLALCVDWTLGRKRTSRFSSGDNGFSFDDKGAYPCRRLCSHSSSYMDCH